MVISRVVAAKRALIAVLKALAAKYRVPLGSMTKDACDDDVHKAYKRVVLRAHPDKGGTHEDAQRLQEARDAYAAAKRVARGRPTGGRPAQSAAQGEQPSALARPDAGYRIRGKGVLLTHYGVQDLPQWNRFLAHARSHVTQWHVKYWCPTLEATKEGALHFHMMLQFLASLDCATERFYFEGLKPRADVHDLLGQGWSGRKFQESLNRGFFYVWADKIGTQRDEAGDEQK